MQKDEFYKYVEHPELLDKESIALLTELVNAFPYFQTARLLLTKALHEQKNFYFDSQLKITATYFSDRKQLHRFINEKPLAEVKVEVSPEILEAAPILENNTPIYKESAEEPVLENKEEVKEERVEEVLEDNKVGVLEEKEAEVVLETKDEGKEEEEVVVVEAIFEEEKVEDVVELAKNEEAEETEIVIEKDSKHSFNEWLKELNKGVNIEKKEEFGVQEGKKEENIFGEKMGIQNDLITNFMNTNPVIPPPKKEFYSPVNMAKLSVMENDDLCSETLAKIYYDQGNFQRAKSMFERLSLKYPKKSSYFAARIKEINDIINK